MNNFYNLEYLSERLSAVCKERDELRKMLDAVIKGQETLQRLHETKSEVVRCRDCKHRRTDKCPMYRTEIVQWINDELMPEWDEIEHDSTKDDGYCDRGERSETDV